MKSLKEFKILVVIPARGGSKGIPKKNIRILAGKPLIAYSILNAIKSKFCPDVIVSTDDEEIARVSSSYGAEIHMRPSNLANDSVTLDPVIYDAVNTVETSKNIKYDIVITMQPTSPLLKTTTLDSAIEFFINNKYDTVLSGINRPHLAWGEVQGEIVPLYKERLNRQYLPKHLNETGAFFISNRENVKTNTRFGQNVSVFEVDESESIDIDTPQDWWIAEKELLKKNIIIRVEGYNEIGTGHIHRCLLLGYNFIDHNIKYVISKKSDIGIEKIKKSYFPYIVIENENEVLDILDEFSCDILINDILNTDSEYIKKCKDKGIKVINFEDLGEGGKFADAVINDLYEKQNEYDNYYWGSKYYCIRDEFLLANPTKFNKEVKEILVSFGGTDPSNLTEKLLRCVPKITEQHQIHFTFILGMGYNNENKLNEIINKNNLQVDVVTNVPHMTDYMSKADIAICSQGRTMLELASMAVPTILLAQNEREQDHEFGYIKNGFLNLGLGSNIEENTIAETLLWLINSPQIRMQIKEQMLKLDLKNGLKRVLRIILEDGEK